MTFVEPTFVEQLRAQTADAHRAAEQAPFIGDLLGGALDTSALTSLLAQYYPVYEALENTSDALTGNPVAAPFLSDDLRRLPSLEHDLIAAAGPDWRNTVEVSSAATTLADRIRNSTTNPIAFLAHHYTRYLGDLSGGQVIATLAKRHYGMSDDQLSFYRFDRIAKPKVFKDNYHALLDNAPWSQADREHFVAETVESYRLNRAIFDAMHTPAAHS